MLSYIRRYLSSSEYMTFYRQDVLKCCTLYCPYIPRKCTRFMLILVSTKVLLYIKYNCIPKVLYAQSDRLQESGGDKSRRLAL